MTRHAVEEPAAAGTGTETPAFRGGRNIALKIPAHQWDATVAFYRDVLRLPERPDIAPDLAFVFGDSCLWLDRVPQLGQAEVWLQVETDDIDAADRHLAAAGAPRCDGIEALPEGAAAFWVSTPAGVVHLVSSPEDGA